MSVARCFHKHVGLVSTARRRLWAKWKCSGFSLLVVADPPSIWQTLGPAAVVPGTPKRTQSYKQRLFFWIQCFMESHVGAYFLSYHFVTSCHCNALFLKNAWKETAVLLVHKTVKWNIRRNAEWELVVASSKLLIGQLVLGTSPYIRQQSNHAQSIIAFHLVLCLCSFCYDFSFLWY